MIQDRIITTHDYAWAAGIIDGEGHIGRYEAGYTHPNGRYYAKTQLRLIITQADYNDDISDMLRRFKYIFKTGYYFKRKKQKEHHTQTHTLMITNKKCERVLRLVWPWLGLAKREQAINAYFNPPE